MSRAQLVILGERDRERAVKLIWQVPNGTRVTFADGKRTIAQNDRLWAMLTDVARQVEWYGTKLKPNDWKLIFLEGLNRQDRTVPNLTNDGFVNLGRSSSELSKTEMSDLLELIAAFGAERGVVFHDPVPSS